MVTSLREQLSTHQQELRSERQLRQSHETQLKEQSALIERLKFELARLKRWRFGQSTEGLAAEQLALWESVLDGDIAALQARLDALEAANNGAGNSPDEPKRQPKRRPLPDSLPRVEVLHDLPCKDCPTCGLGLERIGEEVSEQLDIIPAQFFVRRHVRAKYCCRPCGQLHSAGLPAQPIDKGIAAPGLISHVAVGKYLNHQPLYRQEAEFERMGVAIPRPTMAGWFGELEVLLDPLVDRVIETLLAEPLLHADEIPVPVLDPGAGKTATGYVWAYRGGPWSAVKAVAFDFAMSRASEHPTRFLAAFTGTLVVDGYSGYSAVLRRPDIIEAGCMAHARRPFYEIAQATGSPIAQSALIEIAKLYMIERELKHLPPAQRCEQRRARAAPILAEFKGWLDATHAQSPPKSAIGNALAYSINRWPALIGYLDDGWLNIDNNPVENAVRGIALGRRNWLFAGSEAGGRRAAQFYTLIESAKLNGVNPRDYLTHVLTELPSARARDLDALLPRNYPRQSPPDIIID
ncbi:MAG: IS66 family transposase [Burkholderiales bacterium]|nr:IS66 family transposase [Burkholderiales bacterium]